MWLCWCVRLHADAWLDHKQLLEVVAWRQAQRQQQQQLAAAEAVWMAALTMPQRQSGKRCATG